MERDSVIFYRSFYDAIKALPKDIQLEIYTAVMEYGLNGVVPDNLKPVAKGMFTLIKPNIDVNMTRFENGKKGGRTKKKPQTTADDDYSLTYEQEVEQMRNDEAWRKTVCEDFNITAEEYDRRLSRFLTRCNEDKERKGKERHDSRVDCQSHLRYWMTKAYPAPQSPATLNDNIENDPTSPISDYTFNGGFGGLDT